MTKFEEEFNYLIELSGKVLIGQVDAEAFEKNRIAFFEKYETDQQQALPVVPECVAKDVKRLSLSTLADWNVAVSYISKETLEWLSTTGNTNIFLGKSWTLCSLKINGFKVEKPQLFYLKHIDMSKRDKNHDYFAQIRNDRFEHDSVRNNTLPGVEVVGVKFTQQEIDSMKTGSYEKIEVAE
ncbi:DUF1642 domain-containing protein [Lactococcus lactis]|uniref:DUF1642 domain-containing protein n=1 Tax=Lactococcus lactis TaxID=1358 RepID=UPI0020260666|nr:DUF1642 domain-containing protein [Lactococcus lactis]MCL9639891.1 DUF1642 domain-containing protein [Lactococcus lactis]